MREGKKDLMMMMMHIEEHRGAQPVTAFFWSLMFSTEESGYAHEDRTIDALSFFSFFFKVHKEQSLGELVLPLFQDGERTDG